MPKIYARICGWLFIFTLTIVAFSLAFVLGFSLTCHAQTLTVKSTAIVNGPQAEQDDLSVRLSESLLPPSETVAYEITGLADCPNGAHEDIAYTFSLQASKRGVISNTVLVEEPNNCVGTPAYSSLTLCDQTNAICIGF